MALPEELADLLDQLQRLIVDGIESITLCIEPDWEAGNDEDEPAPANIKEFRLQIKGNSGGGTVRGRLPFSATRDEMADLIRKEVETELRESQTRHKTTQLRLESLKESINNLRKIVPSALEELAQAAEKPND